MYNIILNSNVYKYEVSELIRLFMRRSDFSIVGRAADAEPGAVVIDGPEDMRDKNAVKRHYFDIFSERTGYRPPWGILTGVRPMKISDGLYGKGAGDAEVERALREEYYLADDKIRLLLETSRYQRSVSKLKKERMVSLYIGIPFCPTRCIYCSFPSNVADERTIGRYMEALLKEMRYVSEQMHARDILAETIYIGGGTPTSIPDDRFEELLCAVDALFDRRGLSEYTIEAGRPDTITDEKLTIIGEHPCDRISINPQSMRQKTLDAIGRRHTTEQIADAFRRAGKIPGLNINADLIAGLPGEDLEDFRFTLDRVLEFDPANITVHTLAVKRASALKALCGDFNDERGGILEGMTSMAADRLDTAGYAPYYLYRQKQMAGNHENVGYTKPGKHCLYNMRIMEEHQTNIALGAGGITKVFYAPEDRLERIPNVSNHEIYIDRIDEMIERKKTHYFEAFLNTDEEPGGTSC